MQKPGKMKDVKEKIYARARDALQHWAGNAVRASIGKRAEVGGRSSKKFSGGEQIAKRGMRLFGVGSPVELTQVAAGSAMQCLE